MKDHTVCVWKDKTSYISLRTGCLRILFTFGGQKMSLSFSHGRNAQEQATMSLH